jgi:hypothetical protein
MSSVPPAGASMAVVPQGMPGTLLLRPTHAPILYTGTDPGRPKRSTRGVGGQLAQLEKASIIVGEGLLNKVKGQKRDQNNLIDIPENLSENDMAPPIPKKRARMKFVIIIHSTFFLSFLSTEKVSLTICSGSSVATQSF